MEKETDIIKKIESQTPKLSALEISLMWNYIESHLPQKSVLKGYIPSPFWHFEFRTHPMLAGVVLLLLVGFAGGGTAFASNAARPGDMLFTIDRALENIALHFPRSEAAQVSFKNKLSNERLQEFREILEEELEGVKVTSTTTRLSERGQGRVDNAVHEIIKFLDASDLDDTNRGNLITEIAQESQKKGRVERHDNRYRVSDEQNRIEVDVDDDGDIRFEVRRGTERIRIEKKDGEVRVRTQVSDDSDDASNKNNSKKRNSRFDAGDTVDDADHSRGNFYGDSGDDSKDDSSDTTQDDDTHSENDDRDTSKTGTDSSSSGDNDRNDDRGGDSGSGNDGSEEGNGE